jgi:actin related protein 2/3 complex subunit 5
VDACARAQDASYELVSRVIHAIKAADIDAALATLSLSECDVLMKYLYRGLGQTGKKHDDYQLLLKWHPLVIKRAGEGSVMRAISEVKEAL